MWNFKTKPCVGCIDGKIIEAKFRRVSADMTVAMPVKGKDYVFTFGTVLNIEDNTVAAYEAIPNEDPSIVVRFQNPSGRFLSQPELEVELQNALANPEELIKFASDTYEGSAGSSDISTWKPYTDTDWSVTHDGPDHYDYHGVSKGKKKPGGSTTTTKKDMSSITDHDKTGWTDSMQPSSDPDRNTWDAPGSTVPEGEMGGLQPSFHNKASSVYFDIVSSNAEWGFKGDSLFDKFIAGISPLLRTCRNNGLSRVSARNSVIKVNSLLFNKHAWMYPILDRFIDRAYGAPKKIKSSISSIEDSISEFIKDANIKGWNKAKAEAAVKQEFSSWFENYPEMVVVADAQIDTEYTDTAGVSEGITKYKKIILIDTNREGIIVDIKDSTPEQDDISVFWLDTQEVDDVMVSEHNIILQEPSTEELRRATEVMDPKVSSVTISKNAARKYTELFTKDFKEFPVPYTTFRKWCSKQEISLPILYKLERIAIELDYINMPDMVVFSEKEPFVSEDNTEVQMIETGDDPTEAEKVTEVTTETGKKLKKFKGVL